MEFIKFEEATEALGDVGVVVELLDEEHLRLQADSDQLLTKVCHLHLADSSSTAVPRQDAQVISTPKDTLADSVLNMVHQLHLSQLLIVPVGKWRSIFDAVAFSLASNEDWQEVDAMATVELNTRDPLLCGPGDYQTLRTLINALLDDAESPDQGITITSTATPFIAEIIPDGAVRVMIGNQVLADEIAESLNI